MSAEKSSLSKQEQMQQYVSSLNSFWAKYMRAKDGHTVCTQMLATPTSTMQKYVLLHTLTDRYVIPQTLTYIHIKTHTNSNRNLHTDTNLHLM